MQIFLETLKTFFVLWHVAAFALGGVYVWHSYRSLIGCVPYKNSWSKFIQKADIHLWLSGFAIIAVGLVLIGLSKYLSNPKLLTKVIVIVTWLASTRYIRRSALTRFNHGDTVPMYAACGINLACWFYGAFLGCAKGLAYGVVPLWIFITGFSCTIGICLIMTFSLSNPVKLAEGNGGT